VEPQIRPENAKGQVPSLKIQTELASGVEVEGKAMGEVEIILLRHRRRVHLGGAGCKFNPGILVSGSTGCSLHTSDPTLNSCDKLLVRQLLAGERKGKVLDGSAAE
jgi:hypothetical protein